MCNKLSRDSPFMNGMQEICWRRKRSTKDLSGLEVGGLNGDLQLGG